MNNAKELPKAQRFTATTRPIRPGASISSDPGLPGTACAVVRRAGSKHSHLYLLSCEHVLFNAGGTVNPILQPASADLAARSLKQQVAAPALRGGLSTVGINELDAAIALLDPKVMMKNIPLSTNRLFHTTTSSFSAGDNVTIYGRSSGISSGPIIETSLSTELDYRAQGFNRPLKFHNIVSARYQNAGGDSGAPVILTDTGQLIGIHMAGDDNVGFFCKIERVFSRLHLRLA